MRISDWSSDVCSSDLLEHISPGQPVRIRVDGYADVALDGFVDSLAPGSGSAFSLIPADNATGNFVRVVQRVPVKIRLRGTPLYGRLVPGLSAPVAVSPGRGPCRPPAPVPTWVPRV